VAIVLAVVAAAVAAIVAASKATGIATAHVAMPAAIVAAMKMLATVDAWAETFAAEMAYVEMMLFAALHMLVEPCLGFKRFLEQKARGSDAEGAQAVQRAAVTPSARFELSQPSRKDMLLNGSAILNFGNSSST